MRVFSVFTVFLAIFGLFIAGPAKADPKPWVFGWWPEHFQNQDFRPYLEGPKIPHNSQWDRDTWAPEDWITHGGGERAVMDDLMRSNIITGQDVDDEGVPILKVGRGFINLSGQEKRRVVRFVDHVFGMTKKTNNGMFYLYYTDIKKVVGVYTRHGLQIQ